MKQRNRTIKQVFLLVAFTVCFTLLTIDAAAIITPWIDIPEDETDTGTVSEEPSGSEDSVTTSSGEEEKIEFEFSEFTETTDTRESEPDTKQATETPKKKGCRGMITQGGIGLLMIIGITEMCFLKRKEKHDESAS